MERREKILAGSLGAVFAVALGGPYINDNLIKPVTDRQAEVLQLQEDVVNEKLKTRQIRVVKNQLLKCRRHSLPPDSLDAQRLYLAWLTDLAFQSGLNAKLTPDRVIKRGDVFTGVSVKIETKSARQQDLVTFLYRFHRMGLMHRIETVRIVSPENEGDPEMTVIIVAEGLSFPEAEDRATLFPESTLVTELNADATQLQVADAKAINEKPPFRVQIGEEYLLVTAAEDNLWTVERGVDTTSPMAHPAEAPVQFAPIADEMEDETFEEYQQELLAKSLFVLPRRYSPSYRKIGSRSLYVGDRFSATAGVSGMNPREPQPKFQLVEPIPSGMTIDETKGTVLWDPADSQPLDSYPVTVHVVKPGDDEPMFKETFEITLRERPAPPPRLSPPVVKEFPELVVYVGQTRKFTVTGYDPDDEDARLTFRISGEPPLGTSIDEQTGEVTLTPPLSTPPGEYQVTVAVSDEDRPPSTTERVILLYFAEDAARFTRLVACLGQEGDLEAWLFDPLNNRRLILLEGEPFAVANIEGLVTRIGKDFVDYTTGLESFRLELGDDLRKAKLLESAFFPAEPTNEPATAEPSPEDPEPATPAVAEKAVDA